MLRQGFATGLLKGWKYFAGGATGEQQRRASTESILSEKTDQSEQNIVQFDTCMICLDPMSQADLAHPLMCTSKGCYFNSCDSCIESMIDQKPRQGRQPVTSEQTILVSCPNCRSNLSPTICDTVLLRKVDRVQDVGVITDEVVRKVLAFQKAMNGDAAVLREIAKARDREARFWKKKNSSEKEPITRQSRRMSLTSVQKDDDESDEWGFEVDISLGPHESIKLPRDFAPSTFYETFKVVADHTLLNGLDSTIPREEQDELTRLMISGDTSKLAKAAEILSTYTKSIRVQGTSCFVKGTSGKIVRSSSSTAQKMLMRRSSIYYWIEGGKKARRPVVARHKQVAQHTNDLKKVRAPSYHTARANKNQQVERQVRDNLAYMRRHPLPARMPKYAEFCIKLDGAPTDLELDFIVKSLPIRFCNDYWDGTVMDAFTRIFASPKYNTCLQNSLQLVSSLPHRTFIDNYSVTKKRQESTGVRNILDGGLYGCYNRQDLRIDTYHPRVVVADVVDPQAKLQDVLKGDVMTHLNGVELRDVTVDDVIGLIMSLIFSNSDTVFQKHKESTSTVALSGTTTTTLRFVFNADRATAEALKLRALAPDY